MFAYEVANISLIYRQYIANIPPLQRQYIAKDGAPSQRGAQELIRKPRPLAVNRNRRLNKLQFQSHPFSSVQWVLLGIIGYYWVLGIGYYWVLLGIGYYFLSSIIILYYYIISGEVIGFRLFRATGLVFTIRPKDGVIQSSVGCRA